MKIWKTKQYLIIGLLNERNNEIRRLTSMSKHNSIIVSTVCTLTQVGVRSVLLATVYVGSQYYKIIVVTYDYVDDAL